MHIVSLPLTSLHIINYQFLHTTHHPQPCKELKQKDSTRHLVKHFLPPSFFLWSPPKKIHVASQIIMGLEEESVPFEMVGPFVGSNNLFIFETLIKRTPNTNLIGLNIYAGFLNRFFCVKVPFLKFRVDKCVHFRGLVSWWGLTVANGVK